MLRQTALMILMSDSLEREIVDLMQGDCEEMDQLAIAKPLCKAAYRIFTQKTSVLESQEPFAPPSQAAPVGFTGCSAALLGQTMDAAAGAASLVKVIDAAPAQLPVLMRSRALDVLKAASKPLIILGKGAVRAGG